MDEASGLSLEEGKEEEEKKPESIGDSDATQVLNIAVDNPAVEDDATAEKTFPKPIQISEVDILPEPEAKPIPPVVERTVAPTPQTATNKTTERIECMPAFADHCDNIFAKNPAVPTNIACPACSSPLLEVDGHFRIRGKNFAGWLCQKCNALYQNADGSSQFIG